MQPNRDCHSRPAALLPFLPPGLRPVALRPTLSSGLPFSSYFYPLALYKAKGMPKFYLAFLFLYISYGKFWYQKILYKISMLNF
jgi:hypothetical protein